MGKIHPSPLLEIDEDLLICPAFSSTQNNKHIVQISIFLDHPYTLKKGTHIAKISLLTPEQTKHIGPIKTTSVRHLLNNNHDDTIHFINRLCKHPKSMKSMKPIGSQHHKTQAMRGNIRKLRHLFSRIYGC